MTQLVQVKSIANRISDEDVKTILAAVEAQANEDVAPLWQTSTVDIELIDLDDSWASGAWQIQIADTPEQIGASAPGDFGYHDQSEGMPVAYVFVGATLDAGRKPSVTISHEMLEMLGDPFLDQYRMWTNKPKAVMLARELCDPVQDDGFAYPKNGIAVSDFVLPSYFAPGSDWPWDYREVLKAPNTIALGGYQTFYDPVHGLYRQPGDNGDGRASSAFATPYSRRERRLAGAQRRSQLLNPVTATSLTSGLADWRWAFLTVAFVVAFALCAIWITHSAWSGPASDIGMQWLVVEASLLALCIGAGYLRHIRLDGILIDEENRISLSRTQWIVWLLVLLGGFFTESIWNVAQGFTFPSLQPDLYALLGIVSGSAVASGVIVDAKKNDTSALAPPINPQIGTPTQKGSIDCNVSPSEASWADLYLGEEIASRNSLDVSRLQKLVVTVLLVIAYVQMMWSSLSTTLVDAHGKVLVHAHFTSMPQVGSSFLWLLGISHAAYLASKASPKTPATGS